MISCSSFIKTSRDGIRYHYIFEIRFIVFVYILIISHTYCTFIMHVRYGNTKLETRTRNKVLPRQKIIRLSRSIHVLADVSRPTLDFESFFFQ